LAGPALGSITVSVDRYIDVIGFGRPLAVCWRHRAGDAEQNVGL